MLIEYSDDYKSVFYRQFSAQACNYVRTSVFRKSLIDSQWVCRLMGAGPKEGYSVLKVEVETVERMDMGRLF